MTDRDRLIELKRIAPFICCPWCDEEKCVGRENCIEIKNYIAEKALAERNEGK